MKRLAGVAVVAAASTWAAGAGAVEREHHVGIDAGSALLVIHDKSTADLGAGFGAHWTFGLSDAWNLMAEGSWSLVATGQTADPTDGGKSKSYPASVTNVGGGVAYVLDVLSWVPYAGLLVEGYSLTGGTIEGTRTYMGAAVALGLDYRLGRRWAAGVALRQHAFFPAEYPSFTQVLARFEYTWGW